MTPDPRSFGFKLSSRPGASGVQFAGHLLRFCMLSPGPAGQDRILEVNMDTANVLSFLAIGLPVRNAMVKVRKVTFTRETPP